MNTPVDGGGGLGGGPNNGSGANITGEPQQLKIIKTQLIPHPISLQASQLHHQSHNQQHHQQQPQQQSQQHKPLPSPSSIPPQTSAVQCPSNVTTITPTQTHKNPHSSNSSTLSVPLLTGSANAGAPIQLTKCTNLISLNPVAAKITHVKAAAIDGCGTIGPGGGIQTTLTSLGGGGIGSLTTAGGSAIKIASGSAVANSLGLNSSQSTATAIRAIGTGGQSTQVRVVMSTGIVPPSMIKQLEGAAVAGRTQITTIPTAAARSVSNTSITMTRPVTQTTYLPRAAVTATPMSSVGMAATQRLVTPIRASPAGGATGTTVTGLTAAGSFVRGTAVSRNSASPATTVISPAANSSWMTTGQVQLIRAIPHQPRQRIISAQGISNAGGTTVTSSATVSGLVANSGTVAQAVSGQTTIQGIQQAQGATGATIQAVSQAACHNQQQTFVATLATVLPPRQHQATLVYSSNVTTSTPLSQPQQFSPSVGTGQRFAVATPLSSTTGTVGASRQIRPILGKSFSTAKLNTTSISIRAPNIPQLTPTLTANSGGPGGVIGSNNTGLTATTVTSANSPRCNTVVGATGNNVISTTNLPTTRIIQLQQQPGGTAQQIISSTGRIAGNVMLPPIIVNTSAAGKLGLRPPVTMAAKVQSSLTITQLGMGKLPGAGNSGSGLGQQGVTASIQAINTGGGISGNILGNSGPPSVSGTLTSSVSAITATTSQLSAAGQLLTTQNIVSSTSGATVGPLAITTRGGAGGNILTGTITPIKNASAITVGKVMAQAQLAVDSATTLNSVGNLPATSLYIHHTGNAGQRAHSVGNATVTVTSNASAATSNTSSAANTVLTSVGGGVNTTGGGGPFLPPGTIYYESMPASSVQVSTGVLSLTTTTVTSSTISQNQIMSPASLTSLPFVSHGPNSTTTFTVVPSPGGRAIGQLQLPLAGTGSQIQAVPVRFNAQAANSMGVGGSTGDTITMTQATPQIVQGTIAGGLTGQQILIPASHQGGATATLGGQTQHMVIPLQTSIKVTSNNSSGSSLVSSFMRKRDVEGSCVRAAKNLAPTLYSMGSNIVTVSGPSSATTTAGGSFTVATIVPPKNAAHTTEALAKKERTAGGATVTLTRALRPESPASSDGSTTVSANSSPGVEQQMQDGNLVINRDATHFNPINELYANHQQSLSVHLNLMDTAPGSRSSLVEQHRHVASSIQRVNGVPLECPPRKKSRRSTNDSQQSNQSQASLSLPPPSAMGAGIMSQPSGSNNGSSVGESNALGVGGMTGNKENAKPFEFILRRPPNCTLLNGYKQNWKPANNHFQRYSDVKPREERKPTVIDLANQANVLGKINGWKIYHLRSQMEDLCENESLGYDKLSEMLKQMETHDKNSEVERISELLKGNMQRSKIIVDGVNEAQNQIMKIFEHKSHISDIIHRCASKRNFKKREKV